MLQKIKPYTFIYQKVNREVRDKLYDVHTVYDSWVARVHLYCNKTQGFSGIAFAYLIYVYELNKNMFAFVLLQTITSTEFSTETFFTSRRWTGFQTSTYTVHGSVAYVWILIKMTALIPP